MVIDKYNCENGLGSALEFRYGALLFYNARELQLNRARVVDWRILFPMRIR